MSERDHDVQDPTPLADLVREVREEISQVACLPSGAATCGKYRTCHNCVRREKALAALDRLVEAIPHCTHGWRGRSPKNGERIVTPCPACGYQSLFIGDGGHLTCARVPSHGSDGCPSPSVEAAIAEKIEQARREERESRCSECDARCDHGEENHVMICNDERCGLCRP